MITFLKNYSFKHIMLLLSFLTLFVLAVSYAVSMHYLFSTSINQHMGSVWQRQADNIAGQAKFSVLTESEKDIEKVLMLLDNQLIIHVSIYAGDRLLYASGQPSPCLSVDPSVHSFIEKDDYWCLSSLIKDNQGSQIIGKVLLVVSKAEIKGLIQQNLLHNILVVALLTGVIFGVFYYLTKQLTTPLTNLSSVMKRITHNERGLQIEIAGPLDIRDLQHSFNLMVLEIERHKMDLEDKVATRTLALSEAYERAQGASKIKSDMLKIVSHEMKTPLHNAMYYLSLMESGHGNFTSEIMNSHDQLKNQIDTLLDYFQAEANKVVLKKTLFTPVSLLERISKEFEPLCLARENQLTLSCDYEGPLYSDEQLIKQIIINLLANANKHTNQGEVTLSCEHRDQELMISVTDTGCGISAENLQNVFKPFWQADMSSARIHQGIGLGLSICQLFAETIDGRISVTSQEHQGSTFVLSIPMTDPV